MHRSANTKIRDKLIAKLDSALIEMKAEMPIKNPDFKPNRKVKDLKFTKALAEKERALFESRLKK